MIARILVLFVLFAQISSASSNEILTLSLEPFAKKSWRTGKLDFYRTYQYSFKSSGNIKSLTVDTGDQFDLGAALATVDTDDLSSELNQLLAEKAFINQEVKRLSKLAKIDAVSARDVERYKSHSSQLKARIVRVREYLNASTIKAPFNGVVISRNVDLGEFVNPGQPVLVVAPLKDNLVVSTSVSEQELAELHLGKSLMVRDRFNDQAFVGLVKKIASTPNLSTGLFQVDLEVNADTSMTIGKLFDIEVLQDTRMVFKVPSHLASVDFNKTALVRVLDQNNNPTLKRFRVVGFDLDYIYIDARNNTQLSVVK